MESLVHKLLAPNVRFERYKAFNELKRRLIRRERRAARLRDPNWFEEATAACFIHNSNKTWDPDSAPVPHRPIALHRTYFETPPAINSIPLCIRAN
ncbi:unnamed protein product [Leptosia nina]|uniref:Uncharacterized protein n=1 Tax=Leptosia nina TaxID=320188 RepID=A0AAV1JJZ9_9NEOP